MDYKEKFETITIEQKRKDLSVHPLVNHEVIKNASDEQIEVIYYEVFSSMDKAMREVMGESMFEEDFGEGYF